MRKTAEIVIKNSKSTDKINGVVRKGGKMKSFTRLFILTFSLITISLGCTREISPSSKLKLSLPSKVSNKVGALAVTGTLMHIIVNVQGDNMEKQFWSWDGKDPYSGNVLSPPAVIELDVPSGNNRVIQYLGVYESSAGVMQFTYGDQLTNLSGGDQAVTIVASTMGSPATEAQVVGRFLDGADVGPTGVVIAEINPPAGASTLANPPPMEIFAESVFSGWFKFMIFDGVGVTYRKLDGTILLDNVDINHPLFNPGINTQAMRVSVPIHQRAWDHGSGVEMDNIEDGGALDIAYGFFPIGSGTTSWGTCYSNSGVDIDGMYVPGLTDGNFDGYADSPTAIYWNGNGGCSSSNACVTSGGNPSCGGTDWTNQITFDHSSLGEGNDGRLGFNGPFKNLAGNSGSFLQTSHNGSDLSVGWEFLPGIGVGEANGITGVSVYYSTLSNSDIHGGGDFNCDQAVSMHGFSWYTDVVVGNNTAIIYGVPEGTQVALCPFQTIAGMNEYFPGVVSTHGGASEAAPVVSLALNIMGGFTSATQGACVPVEVMGLDNFGNIGKYDMAPTSFALTNTGSGAYYDDPSCGSPLSWAPAVEDIGYKIVYFKSTTAESLQATSSSLTDSSSLPIMMTSTNWAVPAAGVGYSLIHGDLHANNCEPVHLLSVNGSGELAKPSNPGTAYLDDNGGGGSFYSDPNCQSVLSSGAQPVVTSNSTYMVYYLNSSIAGTNLDLRVGDSGMTTIHFSENLNLASTGLPERTVTHVEPYSVASLFTGLCYPVKVSLEDKQGYRTAAQTLVNYDLSVTDGELFSDSMCSSSVGSTASGMINSGSYSDSSYYIIPFQISSTNLQVNVNEFYDYEDIWLTANRTQFKISGSASPYMCNPMMVGLYQSDGVTAIPSSEVQNNIDVQIMIVGAADADISPDSGACAGYSQAPVPLIFPPNVINQSFGLNTQTSPTGMLNAVGSGPSAQGIDSDMSFAF